VRNRHFKPPVREREITADGVRHYSALLGFEIGAHALRAPAATNALDHQADIAKVQEWLGHANIATTRIYDHRPRGRRIVRLSRSPIDLQRDPCAEICYKGNNTLDLSDQTPAIGLATI
jgi:integrase